MRELVSSSWAHNKGQMIGFSKSTTLALWMAIRLSHNSTYNCWKAKSLPKKWTFEQARVLTNATKYPPNNPHIDSSSLHKLRFIFMPCFQNSTYFDNLALIFFSLSTELTTSWPQIGQYRIGLGTLVGSFGEPFALAFHHWIEGPSMGLQRLLVNETLYYIIGQPNESTQI
jgi:hypothetical protein